MTIKAIKMFDAGFMSQPFAFGGEEGKEAFDNQIFYRSSLQNYAIETDDEVILVDTGVDDTFTQPRKTGAPLFMGERTSTYMDALKGAGIDPERVTKILITHKHPDHTGEIAKFPNAKIYFAPEEADAMKLTGANIVRCPFSDGPFFEFERSQTIAPGIHYVFAPGHTRGNCIVIVESEGLFYIIHGDVTYCDAALKANKISTIFEDKTAARDTLDRVRAFIKARPTVYLSTHCPEGYESLELKRVMKLA
ncbi:MAG: MBL fold metallo-hydrolase [Kiritimatiellae bacterium]|nr:MBL fold metallo-hydrolase [Kiritimatiellia bacterium]